MFRCLDGCVHRCMGACVYFRKWMARLKTTWLISGQVYECAGLIRSPPPSLSNLHVLQRFGGWVSHAHQEQRQPLISWTQNGFAIGTDRTGGGGCAFVCMCACVCVYAHVCARGAWACRHRMQTPTDDPSMDGGSAQYQRPNRMHAHTANLFELEPRRRRCLWPTQTISPREGCG